MKKIYTPLVLAIEDNMGDVLTGSFETPDDVFPTSENTATSNISNAVDYEAYNV